MSVHLSAEQLDAVPFVVHGPPGTGLSVAKGVVPANADGLVSSAFHLPTWRSVLAVGAALRDGGRADDDVRDLVVAADLVEVTDLRDETLTMDRTAFTRAFVRAVDAALAHPDGSETQGQARLLVESLRV